MSVKISELVLPDSKLKVSEILEKYPDRNLEDKAFVTRLGPSPTGFIHLGNLYGAFINHKLAKQSNGIFYLRIEDTDQKRLVEGAVDSIIRSLEFFNIDFDEGVTKDSEVGEYGPYTQSKRRDIYQAFAKDLIEKGLAYPCFLTEDEIQSIREKQEKEKILPGIYGEFAKYRDINYEEAKKLIDGGREFVIRFKSAGNDNSFKFKDLIKGEISVTGNIQDVVIIKKDGLPTYHFAHVIDDSLMKTTHVIRGEEWISSLPIHLELFNALGFKAPNYCHTAQLMTIEDGKKRKLSKRKDPHLSLDFYMEEGYHPLAIGEYLMTILNSDFEEWRKENPQLKYDDFELKLGKMSNSGVLFDMDKLQDISKDVILRLEVSEIYDFLINWAEKYDNEFHSIIKKLDRKHVESILNIGRNDNKPRKDLVYGKQIKEFIKYFFNEYFEIEDEYPQEISKEDLHTILTRYLDTYNSNDSQEDWFNKIREIADNLGYALRPKDYKKNPDDFKGHIGHVSTAIRIAIVGRSQSPDLWEIQKILGEKEVRRRIEKEL